MSVSQTELSAGNLQPFHSAPPELIDVQCFKCNLRSPTSRTCYTDRRVLHPQVRPRQRACARRAACVSVLSSVLSSPERPLRVSPCVAREGLSLSLSLGEASRLQELGAIDAVLGAEARLRAVDVKERAAVEVGPAEGGRGALGVGLKREGARERG